MDRVWPLGVTKEHLLTVKNLTISKRLGLLAGAAVAAVVLLTALMVHSSASLADDADRLAEVPDVMRRATLADMYHDGAYASVYRAITAIEASAVETIRPDVQSALDGMRESLTSVATAGLSDAVADAADGVLPLVDDYEATAIAVLDTRAADQPTGAVEADFVAAFKALEEALPVVADAVQIRIDELRSEATDTAAASRRNGVIGGVLATVVFAVIAVLVSRSIVRPVRRTVAVLDEVAAGDLRGRLDATGRDELAAMATSLNTALDELGSAFGEIVQSAEVLAASSEELTATSTQLASSAKETSAQAGYVSSAAEHVAESVSGLASGTSEMTDSIQEISYNAQDAVVVAGRAMTVADETNTTVAKLGTSSAEIGSVVQTITSIAEQTNLLALNATIEAARAGEAGKGFAVVAQEVKELSRATANATADIAGRITAIQSDAEAAVAAIAQITDIIAQIGETQSSIASAVEQQTATTNEMGRSINEASTGSVEIAANIDGMAQTAHTVSAGVEQNRQTAQQLAELAQDLYSLVSAFTC